MLSFEALLMLGALVFYLYDSGMLLYVNELVFLRAKRHWSFSCPGDDWRVHGKSLYIPNPLTPDIAIFRVCWSEAAQYRRDDEGSLENYLAALTLLRRMVVTLLVLFFIGLPLVLILFGSGPQLLWLFGVVYLNISLMLVQVYRKKDAFGMSNRKVLALSFESLACAPFALNILRKLTLHRTLTGDPVEFAKKIFDQDTFQRLLDVVCRKIDEQLEFVEMDTPRYFALQSYKLRIDGMK